jgi:hypothetical protein
VSRKGFVLVEMYRFEKLSVDLTRPGNNFKLV